MKFMDESVKKIHQEAISLYKRGFWDEAISKWKEALEVAPQDESILYSLGIVYFERKKYEEAVEILRKVIELNPQHVKALTILGTALIKLRQFDEAFQCLQRSIEINPDNTLAYLNLGALFGIRREFDRGIEMFQRVIELNPKEARGFLGLAKIYTALGNFEKANEYFQRVIELDPNGALGNYARKAMHSVAAPAEAKKQLEQSYSEGFRFYLGGYYQEAIKRYEDYLSVYPKDDLVNYALGEAYLRTGQLKQAFMAFKNAILNRPKRGLYYQEMALVLNEIGQPHDVIEILKKARDFGKNGSLSLTLLGMNLIKARRFMEAIDMLRQAIKKDKNNLRALFELSKVLIELGRGDEARVYLDQILNSPVKSPLKEEAKKLLGQMTGGMAS